MRNKVSIIGNKYGRLFVIADAPPVISGKHKTKCPAVYAVCECGKHGRYITANIKRSTTLSCGCLKAELMRARIRLINEARKARRNGQNKPSCPVDVDT